MLSPPSPPSILLIDDSHEDLFLAKRLLARTGLKHAIITIDGGEEAIVYLRACLTPGAAALKPAAIFCDVRMPKQNGLDVLCWTRRHAEMKAIPFFILSGGDVDTDREKARAFGATEYLVKFPTPEELKRQLIRVGVL